ncbi:hypothetical protein O1L55_20650 [Streptomyces albulus]|nr:hypothetical protein [Streptomyces noursei]
MTSIEIINDMARSADAYTPDAPDSAGARFLGSLHSALCEAAEWGRIAAPGEHTESGEYAEDVISEIAYAATPTYTHELMMAYVDLGAYREDVDDWGRADNGEEWARHSLEQMAFRAAFEWVENYLAENND